MFLNRRKNRKYKNERYKRTFVSTILGTLALAKSHIINCHIKGFRDIFVTPCGTHGVNA